MSVATQKPRAKSGGFGETVKVIIQALLLALIVRTFLFQPFNIPSGSMKATLLVGDYLFVSKYSFGYSRYSFPFGGSWVFDSFNGRIWAAEPERGDIAVFKLPRDGQTDYIKRVIGLPGDRIQMVDGVLHINGSAIERERVEDYVEVSSSGRTISVPRYRETLPNGVSYLTLDLDPNGAEDNTPVYEVPQEHFFMMGDNRDNSTDSRVLSAVGYVPFENLVGRAEVIFFSTDGSARIWEIWNWFSATRWNRLFHEVD